MSGFALFHWSTADCMPPSQLTKDNVTLPCEPPVAAVPAGELEEPHAVIARAVAARARAAVPLMRLVRNPLPPWKVGSDTLGPGGVGARRRLQADPLAPGEAGELALPAV